MKEDDPLKKRPMPAQAMRILMILNYSKSVALLETPLGKILVCKN